MNINTGDKSKWAMNTIILDSRLNVYRECCTTIWELFWFDDQSRYLIR